MTPELLFFSSILAGLIIWPQVQTQEKEEREEEKRAENGAKRNKNRDKGDRNSEIILDKLN